MYDVPAHINPATASLPASYESAKQALAECSSLDECKGWSDKAAALASYAKQADDETLEKHAMRIRARAIRRAGELLKTYDGKGNNQHTDATVPMHQAATNAGMSERQTKTAVRLSNIPEQEFIDTVEGCEKFTVTQLAEKGKKTKPEPCNPYPDASPAPEGFKEATNAIGAIKRFAEFAKQHDPLHVANGVLPYEVDDLRERVAVIDGWLDRFVVNLKKEAS